MLVKIKRIEKSKTNEKFRKKKISIKKKKKSENNVLKNIFEKIFFFAFTLKMRKKHQN